MDRALRQAAEIQFVNDGQYIDLEPHHMDLRPLGHHVQSITQGVDGDETALELEQPQKVDVVRRQVTQCAQVGQLVLRETQAAQDVQLSIHICCQFGQREGRCIAAYKAVLGLVGRHGVQHGLLHGELV